MLASSSTVDLARRVAPKAENHRPHASKHPADYRAVRAIGMQRCLPGGIGRAPLGGGKFAWSDGYGGTLASGRWRSKPHNGCRSSTTASGHRQEKRATPTVQALRTGWSLSKASSKKRTVEATDLEEPTERVD